MKSERAVYPEGSQGRVENYLATLIEALRMRGITALFTKEIHQVVAPELDFADNPISVMAENVLLLRKVEYEGGLHHVLSVIKMRFSAHDASTVREFTIDVPDGIRVLAPRRVAGRSSVMSRSRKGSVALARCQAHEGASCTAAAGDAKARGRRAKAAAPPRIRRRTYREWGRYGCARRPWAHTRRGAKRAGALC